MPESSDPLSTLLAELARSPAAFPPPPPDFIRPPRQEVGDWVAAVQRKRRGHDRFAERLSRLVPEVAAQVLPTELAGPMLPLAVVADPQVHELQVAPAPGWPAALTADVAPELVPEATSHVPADRVAHIVLEVHQPAQQTGGAVLHLHGGAFWMGARLPSQRRELACLAVLTGCVMIDVDFRPAPEHRYATTVSDALAALRWVREHAVTLDIDAARMVVMGASSGAHLAALVALHEARTGGELAGQALLVPSLDLHRLGLAHNVTKETRSRRSDQMAAVFGERDLEVLRRSSPLVSPARTADVAGAAPALIVLGERDEVVVGGQEYAHRLVSADVDVVIRHTMRTHTITTPVESRRLVTAVAEWLRERTATA